MSEQYSLADVQQILKQASILEQENTITRKQLLEIASEVGISSATLHQAEKSWLLKQKTNQLKLIQQSRRQIDVSSSASMTRSHPFGLTSRLIQLKYIKPDESFHTFFPKLFAILKWFVRLVLRHQQFVLYKAP